MRVLHIGKYYAPFSGGIENFMADLLPAFESHGIKTAALIHNHDTRCKKTVVEKQGNILLYRVPCHGALLYAPISPLFPLVLARAIREFRPDILHLHMPNTSAFWVLFLTGAKKLPIVIHWHSDVVRSRIDKNLSYAYHFYKPFEQKILSIASKIIVTSKPYLETSTPLTRWKGKTVVIPLGLDKKKQPTVKKRYRQWAESVWGDQLTRVIAIGRLTYYKGHGELINAGALCPGVRIIIVGKGELLQSLKQKVAALRIKSRVTIMGYLEAEKLAALLAAADFLVLSSLERTEAFGMVLLEAMRAGKSTVISNVPGSGMGWVVQNGVTGLHASAGDYHNLAKKINILKSNPQLRRIMGRNALSRFNTHYSINKISLSISNIYHDVSRRFTF